MRDGEATAGVNRYLGDFNYAVIPSTLSQVSQQQSNLGSIMTYLPEQEV